MGLLSVQKVYYLIIIVI